MKTKIESFTPMGTQQLMETNGGGFAHDVGRVLRFLSMTIGANPIQIANAISDWQVNAIEE